RGYRVRELRGFLDRNDVLFCLGHGYISPVKLCRCWRRLCGDAVIYEGRVSYATLKFFAAYLFARSSRTSVTSAKLILPAVGVPMAVIYSDRYRGCRLAGKAGNHGNRATTWFAVRLAIAMWPVSASVVQVPGRYVGVPASGAAWRAKLYEVAPVTALPSATISSGRKVPMP